jgi:hypothetical protein
MKYGMLSTINIVPSSDYGIKNKLFKVFRK